MCAVHKDCKPAAVTSGLGGKGEPAYLTGWVTPTGPTSLLSFVCFEITQQELRWAQGVMMSEVAACLPSPDSSSDKS